MDRLWWSRWCSIWTQPKNQVLKMGTRSELGGLGRFDPDHFSAIKDCVYSAFWAFRYIRAYGGWCVHSGRRWTSRYSRKPTDKICPLILSHPARTSIVQDQVVKMTTWLQGLESTQMHFLKGYLIKRPWTFCPHLVQSIKVFRDLQLHWTFCPVPSKSSCHRDNLGWCWSNWPTPLYRHEESRI